MADALAPTSAYQRPTFRTLSRAPKSTSLLLSRVLLILCVSAALVAIALLAFITGYVMYMGAKSISGEFFYALPAPDGGGGVLNAITGSLVIVSLASLIGVPIGTLTGIYLSQNARDSFLARNVRIIVDVLAGVPSIVVGILAYGVIVVGMDFPGGWGWQGFGYSGLAGAFALAFIMVPIVAKTSEGMLRLVPGTYQEASLGLGASRSQTLLRVVLPAARAGIITGIMLAVARVAGETAPLLFTIFGGDFVQWDPTKPMHALPLRIFQDTEFAGEAYQQRAWAGMIVLVSLIFVINIAIRLATRGMAPKGRN